LSNPSTGVVVLALKCGLIAGVVLLPEISARKIYVKFIKRNKRRWLRGNRLGRKKGGGCNRLETKPCIVDKARPSGAGRGVKWVAVCLGARCRLVVPASASCQVRRQASLRTPICVIPKDTTLLLRHQGAATLKYNFP